LHPDIDAMGILLHEHRLPLLVDGKRVSRP
jgi:hypothetical protein